MFSISGYKPPNGYELRCIDIIVLFPSRALEYVSPSYFDEPFFFRSRGPGRIHPRIIGTTNTSINNHPPVDASLPRRVQKLSGALLTTVSAVTEIGSPLTDVPAVRAEAVALVTPAAIGGTRTPPGKTLVAPTTAEVAAPVIRLLFNFGKLHPAILSEKRTSQRDT